MIYKLPTDYHILEKQKHLYCIAKTLLASLSSDYTIVSGLKCQFYRPAKHPQCKQTRSLGHPNDQQNNAPPSPSM